MSARLYAKPVPTGARGGSVLQPLRNFLALVALAVLTVAGPLGAQGATASPPDRLDFMGDPLAQFVAYAAALGIAEDEITEAIFEGRFVPDPQDLRLVLTRLGGADCSQALQRLVADRWATPGQFANFDCLMDYTARPGDHHAAWNARFGAPPDEDVFVLTSRLYYVMTRKRPDPAWVNQPYDRGARSAEAQALMAEVRAWSAPYHFLWNDAGTPRRDLATRYDRMRATYLETLSQRAPADRLAEIGLVGDDAAIDALGTEWPGSVLALFLHGDPDRIRWSWWAWISMAYGLPQQDWRAAVERNVRSDEPGYIEMVAIWALVRHAEIGDCGDPTTIMVHTSTPITDVFRGGIWEDRIEGLPTRSSFAALADFANVLTAAPATVRGDLSAFEGLAARLGCDSAVRRAMEANMLAHFEGRPPAFISGY